MAVSLSNNFSLYNPPKTLISKKPTSYRHFNPSAISFSINKSKSPLLFLSNSKTPFSFNSSFSVKATNFPSQINDQDEVHLDDVKNTVNDGGEKSPTLKSLLKVYKEAVLIGDERTASEVESLICEVENEKNELVTKTSTLRAEMNSGKERYIRLQADFDNFRKRSEKEKLTIRSDAEGEVIGSLLPMVDNFERAKQQLKLQTDQEKKIDASYQGIYKQFVEIMRSLRVAVVATVGKPFDPLLHEAIAREPSQEYKEGIIIQEFRRGFLLGDRLLRPATVKVSAGPGKKKQSTVVKEPTEQSAAAAGVDDSR
ncbi:GrpE protein-like [Heracleum sosnowskyi]|uniref:GrpE protein homolog n=1 Tax=Heracleum sosnowskyi TaxID=360622 RepID=A0AAD8JG60_9APIA|nr:GrpE protein-like [Heracleum sosnowskyi]